MNNNHSSSSFATRYAAAIKDQKRWLIEGRLSIINFTQDQTSHARDPEVMKVINTLKKSQLEAATTKPDTDEDTVYVHKQATKICESVKSALMGKEPHLVHVYIPTKRPLSSTPMRVAIDPERLDEPESPMEIGSCDTTVWYIGKYKDLPSFADSELIHLVRWSVVDSEKETGEKVHTFLDPGNAQSKASQAETAST